MMRSTSIAVGVVVAMSAAQYVQSAESPHLSFSYNDWELVCDNTRTCRAAGYSADGDALPISVLLTRKAGPNQAVTGELMIGQYGDNEAVNTLPSEFKLVMHINQKEGEALTVHKEHLLVPLPHKHVEALLAALTYSSQIEWVAGENHWHLSDKGAAAVLLKMDEYQGRIGTAKALVKKGSLGEEGVLPPLPPLQVIAAPLAALRSNDSPLGVNKPKALRKVLRTTITNKEECPSLFKKESSADDSETTLSIHKLTENKLLVSTQCWSGAYNMGYGYWVMNDAPPYHPMLVTMSGSDYKEGKIISSQKDRGLGDCWSSEAWTWDGKQFVHTESSSTGMCRLIAPGGAWSLPKIITDVRH